MLIKKKDKNTESRREDGVAEQANNQNLISVFVIVGKMTNILLRASLGKGPLQFTLMSLTETAFFPTTF